MLKWLSNLFLLVTRKLLYVFVRTTVLPEDLKQLQLDPDKPVCYVLQTRFFSNLLVLETETRRTGLPRALKPMASTRLREDRSLFFLTRSDNPSPLARNRFEYSPRFVRLVQAVRDNPDLDVQLVPVSSANRVPYLQTDKVDLVISSMGKNAEREKVIDFTRAYAPFFLGVFGPKGDEIKAASALSGKSIGVTRGAVEDMVLSEMAPKDAQVKRYEDNNTTLSAYLSGQVQYVATGNLVVAAIARQNPAKAPVAQFMLKDSPCYIGLKKDEPALKAKVNALIEQGIKDGTLNKLSEEWLKAPLPANLGA